MNADDFTSSLQSHLWFSNVLDSRLIFLQFVIGVLCFDVLSQVPIATGYVFDEHQNVGESSLKSKPQAIWGRLEKDAVCLHKQKENSPSPARPWQHPRIDLNRQQFCQVIL